MGVARWPSWARFAKRGKPCEQNWHLVDSQNWGLSTQGLDPSAPVPPSRRQTDKRVTGGSRGSWIWRLLFASDITRRSFLVLTLLMKDLSCPSPPNRRVPEARRADLGRFRPAMLSERNCFGTQLMTTAWYNICSVWFRNGLVQFSEYYV